MYYNITESTYEENRLLFKTTTTGKLEDNILTYHTENDTIKFNLNNYSFTKENNESILKITENKCFLTLKELNQTLEIPYDYINFNYEHNNITFIYKLISNEYPIKIYLNIGDERNDI